MKNYYKFASLALYANELTKGRKKFKKTYIGYKTLLTRLDKLS